MSKLTYSVIALILCGVSSLSFAQYVYRVTSSDSILFGRLVKYDNNLAFIERCGLSAHFGLFHESRPRYIDVWLANDVEQLSADNALLVDELKCFREGQ